MNPLLPGTHEHPTGQRLNISLAFQDNKRRWRKSAKDINALIDELPYTKQTVPDDEAPAVRKQDKRTVMLTNHLSACRWIWNNKALIADNMPQELKAKINNMVISEAAILHGNATTYDYSVDSYAMDSLMREIDRILTRDILSGSDFWTRRFWLDSYIDPAVADGVTDSFESAVRIAAGTPVEQSLAILSAQQQLQTPAYMDRLRLIHSRTFDEMESLTVSMKAQLRSVLTEGMARGVGVRDLKGMVNKRLSVGLSSAERIVRTEINNAYRNAYMDEAKELNETALADDDYAIMQAHRSALSPTTRPNHAARHGNIYTMQQQKNWWATGSNSINCLCSTLDVLVNKKTGKVLQSKMIKRMEKQKEEWFPSK